MIQKFRPYLSAAAIVIALIFGATILFRPDSTEKLADQYIQEHFQTLGVTMGPKPDSMQQALRLYNEGKLSEALRQFEILAQRDTSNSVAKKYAGIVSLRLKDYDKAIDYFSQLGNARLYANPGKFFQALTYLKRKKTGDRQEAKNILEQVVQADLEGKEIARKLLNEW